MMWFNMNEERIEPLTLNTTGTPVQNYDEVIEYLKQREDEHKCSTENTHTTH